MKTPQQEKYEHLIMRIIKSNAYVMERKGLLEDFLEDCDLYYDLFCEQIYTFFEKREKGVLLIDERGRLHINPVEKRGSHIYFDLLSDTDYIKDSSDVIDYINLALTRLETQIDVIYRSITL